MSVYNSFIRDGNWKDAKRRATARHVYPVYAIYYTLIADFSRILYYSTDKSRTTDKDAEMTKQALSNAISVLVNFPDIVNDLFYKKEGVNLRDYYVANYTITKVPNSENAEPILNVLNCLLELDQVILRLRYAGQKFEMLRFDATPNDYEYTMRKLKDLTNILLDTFTVGYDK